MKLVKIIFLATLLACIVFPGLDASAMVARFKKINRINTEGAVSFAKRNRTIKVQLISPTTGKLLSTQKLVSDASDKFNLDISGITSGAIDVKVIVDGFLSQTVQNVDISSGALDNFGVPLLLGGDTNSDGVVDDADGQILKNNWTSNYEGTDLNGDGIVNAMDFAILKHNINKKAQ